MDTQVFEHPDFVICVPSHWLNILSSKFAAVFVVPPFPEGTGANVSVALMHLPEAVTLQDLDGQLEALHQSDYPDYRVEQEGEFGAVNAPGIFRRYVWLNTEQNLWITHFQVVYIDDAGLRGGVVTGTRPQEMSEGEGEVLDRLFEEIAVSFEFQASAEG